jgi:hypothetical protein
MPQSMFDAGLQKCENAVNKRVWIVSSAAVLLLAGIAFYAYRLWRGNESSARHSMLAILPANASAVAYANFADLRQSPFAAEFYAWVPRPQQVDAGYAEFLRDTGFDYERDLNQVAIATLKRGQGTSLFAVADGRFDQKRITAYASQSGTHENRNGRQIFTIAVGGAPNKISFTFLRKNRIALTDDSSLAALLAESPQGADAKEWLQRFERLAGSPVFAVIRQDAATGSALASRAPGGLQSPQLSALLDQLQWITLAGKPEGDRLRIVAEGECPLEGPAHQLSDMLNGGLLLAQAGLNDPKTRQQLDPQAREAYLEMLKGADVSRLDRGETKSVRLVFDVTPKFLAAARNAVPAVPIAPAIPAPKAQPGKTQSRK